LSSTAAMVVRSTPIQASVFCLFFTILWPPFSFPHLLHNDSWLAAERKGDLVLAGWERELSIYGRLKRGTEKGSLVSQRERADRP
jgi:hypothetical protein